MILYRNCYSVIITDVIDHEIYTPTLYYDIHYYNNIYNFKYNLKIIYKCYILLQ